VTPILHQQWKSQARANNVTLEFIQQMRLYILMQKNNDIDYWC